MRSRRHAAAGAPSAGGAARVCGHQGNGGAARQADGEACRACVDTVCPGGSLGRDTGHAWVYSQATCLINLVSGLLSRCVKFVPTCCEHVCALMCPGLQDAGPIISLTSICSLHVLTAALFYCYHSLQETGPIISFDFRKLHFILDSADLTFRKLKYPTKVKNAKRESLWCLETFAADPASSRLLAPPQPTLPTFHLVCPPCCRRHLLSTAAPV